MERPIVPNITRSNRAKNRRVNFIIKERSEVAVPPPAPVAKPAPDVASKPAAESKTAAPVSKDEAKPAAQRPKKK